MRAPGSCSGSPPGPLRRSTVRAGLYRIGIDDKSYKKGHKYLMVVVDHDTGRVVWACQGHDQATVKAFFDALGPARAKMLTHVTCDGAQWIHQVIATTGPGGADLHGARST